jgi:hypothetical protein
MHAAACVRCRTDQETGAEQMEMIHDQNTKPLGPLPTHAHGSRWHGISVTSHNWSRSFLSPFRTNILINLVLLRDSVAAIDHPLQWMGGHKCET